jgi:hypothetical protein
MLLPALTGFGLAELVTVRSAWPALATATVVVTVLLAVFVSRVLVPTVAVSVMMVPDAVPEPTATTTGKVLVDPGATLGLVQLMLPLVVQVHPAGTELKDTKVVLAGIASVNVAVLQLLGPVFETTWV